MTDYPQATLLQYLRIMEEIAPGSAGDVQRNVTTDAVVKRIAKRFDIPEAEARTIAEQLAMWLGEIGLPTIKADNAH